MDRPTESVDGDAPMSTVMRRCRLAPRLRPEVAVESEAAKSAAGAPVNVYARQEEKVDGVSQINIVEQITTGSENGCL